MTDQPNIVVLMADQHRSDAMSCAGRAGVRTPNLDALAGRGMRFDQAYCAAPLCGPSRVSFFTGTWPHTHGAYMHPNDRHRSGRKFSPQLNMDLTPLPQLLRDRGYATHACGYIGTLASDGDRNLNGDAHPEFWGFDAATSTPSDYRDAVGPDVVRRYNLADIRGEMWEPGYFNVDGEPFAYDESKMWDRQIADAAIDYLKGASDGQPFFLYAGFRAPHPPWCAPQRFHEMYDPDNPDDVGPLPDFRYRYDNKPRRVMERFDYFDIRYYDEAMVRRSIAGYFAMVSMIDAYVGEILAALDATGQRDNTIVVFTSDHGENLYDHGLCEKHTFFDSSVRVPMIVDWPGVTEGDTSDELISLIDLMPTLVDAAGAEVPAAVEGVDIRPALRGDAVREDVRAEHYHSLDPSRMVREKRFKYIHTEDDIDELYDMRHDPDERVNLAWYPEYKPVVDRMEAKALEDWEIPDVPLHGTWNDLNERKQRQRLRGEAIHDLRPHNKAPFPLPDELR